MFGSNPTDGPYPHKGRIRPLGIIRIIVLAVEFVTPTGRVGAGTNLYRGHSMEVRLRMYTSLTYKSAGGESTIGLRGLHDR